MPNTNTAVIPVPKLENDFYDWYARHEEKCRLLAARQDYGIVFIGDSITHLFEAADQGGPRGLRVWNEFYARRKPLGLGFGWDRTQNVLWRLQHGEFTGLMPQLAVLLVGTNNLTGTANARTNTPPEIVAGITAICDEIHLRSPQTVVLALGVLPRSTPNDPLRDQIREINAGLVALPASRPFVRHLDFGAHFLQPDGSIPTSLMNDLVHPLEPGYRLWAEAIESIVAECCG